MRTGVSRRWQGVPPTPFGRSRIRLALTRAGDLVVVGVAALLLSAGGCAGGAEKPDVSLLPGPNAVAGCAQESAPQRFVGAELYELIDGAAPRFLDRGFRWAVAGAYECASGRVAVEVYRMTAPAGARTVFDEQAGAGQPAGVGDASRLSSGFLEFIRGPFYVTVTGFQPGAAAQADIAAVGRAVNSHL